MNFEEAPRKSTTDLWFASFLLMRKNIVPDAWQTNDRGRIRYFYDLSEEDWAEFRKECATDDITNMKYTMERLKDISF